MLMQPFYLNCWVPSIKNYLKIQELKMSQFDILSKYIANNDNIHIANCLENIIEENLEDKNYFTELTKFDKWFILTFLRASSVSPSLYFIAKDKNNSECNIEFNLFNVLTELSEVNFDPIEPLAKDNTSLVLMPSRKLYNDNPILESIFSITVDKETTYIDLLAEKEKRLLFNSVEDNLKTNILQHTSAYDKKLKNLFLIKSNPGLKNFNPVSLRLFDNTLYNFVVMIYKPFAKSIYNKKYNLVSKLKMSLADIGELTPVECDVYLGMLTAELKEAKESKKTSIYK